MKKLIMVLLSIALLSVIVAAGIFSYNSYKNLTEDKKVEVSKENKKEEKELSNESESNSNNETTDDRQEKVNNNSEAELNKELNVEEEINKADTDGDGVATTDEMTPELEELTKQGKFQPISRGMIESINEEKENERQQESEIVHDANGREAELAAEGEVKAPGEPGSTAVEENPEDNPESFDLD